MCLPGQRWTVSVLRYSSGLILHTFVCVQMCRSAPVPPVDYWVGWLTTEQGGGGGGGDVSKNIL